MEKSNMRLQKEMNIVVDPLSLKNPKHKFLSSTFPIPATSLLQSRESQSKVSNLTHKNCIIDWRSMSLSKNQATTHHVEVKHDNKHQGRFSKDSGKRMEDVGFKLNGLCMCLPGFGKSKQVKARKGGFQMDHSVDPVMSSTLSLENIEFKAGVTQGKGIIVQESDHEDDSRSSYFDLPSIMLKCNGDGA